MKYSNDSGKVIAGLLCGAAAGAVLGILFAPDKGSETRKKIAGRSDELTDAMKEKIKEFLGEIKSEAQLVKDKASEFMETEKDLNEKIIEITMKINDKYPELTKYIEEMSATIPDVKNPEITIKYLRTYYDSLKSMLNKYMVDHPKENKEA